MARFMNVGGMVQAVQKLSTIGEDGHIQLELINQIVLFLDH